MTDMYNVLERLRTGEPLSDRDRLIHERGLVSVLKELHDDLDKAIYDVYGWGHDISDEEILEHLVALNYERAAEEELGLVRWLRPEYQHPEGMTQRALDVIDKGAKRATMKAPTKLSFPTNLAEQARAVRNALTASTGVVTPSQLAKGFQRARTDRIEELLQTLVLLGHARLVEEGKYVAGN
jgi:hypothetical protein